MTAPAIFGRDFNENSNRNFIGGLVVLDRFVQRRFVLNEVLLSIIIIPPHLERTRSELKAFLNLTNVRKVQKVRRGREDSNLRPELIAGALSCSIEGQFLVFCVVVVATDY